MIVFFAIMLPNVTGVSQDSIKFPGDVKRYRKVFGNNIMIYAAKERPKSKWESSIAHHYHACTRNNVPSALALYRMIVTK